MLVISDRVKETSITTGTGDVVLNGAYGSFQTFNAGIGDGNTTYYAIENNSRWEVGQGVYTASSNSISRDVVFDSSVGGSKITLDGVSTVFCTLPASRAFIEDPDGGVQVVDIVSTRDGNIKDLTVDTIFVSGDSNLQGSLNISGDTVVSGDLSVLGDLDLNLGGDIDADEITAKFLTLIRPNSAGNFLHAYKDDGTNQTVSLWVDSNVSPLWRLGLKTNPLNQAATPTFGYIFGRDGSVGSVSDTNNYFSIANTLGFSVTHDGHLIFRASSDTGVYIDGKSTLYPALTIQGAPLNAEDLQRWENYTGTVLSVIDSGGKVGILTDSPIYDLDVDGSGRLESVYLTSGIYFQDGTFQTTAHSDVLTNQVSGWADNTITSRDNAVSGYFETRTDNNTADILTVSGLLYDDASLSGYVDSRDTAVSGWAKAYVDSQDHSATAVSGWAQAYVDSQDHSATAVSGWADGTFLTSSSTEFTYISGVAVYASGLAGTGGGDVTTEQLEGVSGIAVYASGQVGQNSSDIITVSGLLYDDASISGYIDLQDAAISGWAQAYVDSQDHSATAVSGWAGSYADTGDAAVSGWADSTMDTRDAAVSGWAQAYVDSQDHSASAVSGWADSTMTSRDSAVSGWAGSYADAGDTAVSGWTDSSMDIRDAAVSGWARDYVDSQDHSASAVSGWAGSYADAGDAAVSGWAQAYVDGQGYLTSVVEDTTPQLGGTLDANGNTINMGSNEITDTKVGQWDTAYGWANHASAGYLTSETSHTDVLVDGDFSSQGIMLRGASVGTYSILTDNSTSWNTAYGWGDHASAGYLSNVVEDTTPQLGGHLDCQSYHVSGVSLLELEGGFKTTLESNTDGSTVTFDLNAANTHTVTLGGNRALALSNVDVGQKFIIRLVQDGTGTRTVTWFSTIKWPGGLVPTLTTTGGKTDVFGFICTATNQYDGYVIGYNL